MEGKRRGSEMRRIHVIYFLSRGGRPEHPHLFRVHQVTPTGVYLRDIKRWLADLRGKDMPESFSWSYKRRFKTGYIWQDLVDNDLLTPISDNEYVLQGSEKQPSPVSSSYDSCSSNDGKDQLSEAEPNPGVSTSCSKLVQQQESPLSGSENSSLTDDATIELEQHLSLDYKKEEQKKNVKLQHDRIDMQEGHRRAVPVGASSSTHQSRFTKKSTGCSDGASHMFRSLISCGATDTKDAFLVMPNRPRDSRMSFKDANSWKKTSEKQKVVSPAYKPVSVPNCSQCGKSFKPEKMHKHMKSCRGMKLGLSRKGPAPTSATTPEKKFSAMFVNDASPAYPAPPHSLLTYDC